MLNINIINGPRHKVVIRYENENTREKITISAQISRDNESNHQKCNDNDDNRCRKQGSIEITIEKNIMRIEIVSLEGNQKTA
jgi:hypothetical protein